MPILWKLDVRLDSPLVLGACCEDTLRTDFGQALVGLIGQYVRMLVGKHVGRVENVIKWT